MKMKTWYIYAAVAIAAVVLLVVFTNIDNKANKPNTETTNKEMPNDEVHKGMQNNQPGKGNVSEKVVKQMELMKEDLSKTPNDTAKMRMLGDFLTAAHKPDEAAELYENILKKDPARKDILFSLSFAYYQKKDFVKAEEVTKRILKIDKNDLQAQYNLGAIAASRGETTKARDLWIKFIQEHPQGELSDLARNNLTQLK